MLVKEKEDRLLLWQELRRLVLRGNAAAAAAWVRSCVAELGRPAAGGSGGAAAGGRQRVQQRRMRQQTSKPAGTARVGARQREMLCSVCLPAARVCTHAQHVHPL